MEIERKMDFSREGGEPYLVSSTGSESWNNCTGIPNTELKLSTGMPFFAKCQNFESYQQK